VAAHAIGKNVASTFHGSSTHDADAGPIPFPRWHSVNADVVAIAEAIEAVLLDFVERQNLVAFWTVEQQVTVVNIRRFVLWPLSSQGNQILMDEAWMVGRRRGFEATQASWQRIRVSAPWPHLGNTLCVPQQTLRVRSR